MRAGVSSLGMPRTAYVVSFLLFATAIGHVLVSGEVESHIRNPIYSPPTKRLYVSVIAGPFTGSSALSGLLSSSPDVDCMSHAHTWQNEGTWLLTQKNVSDGGMPKFKRWDPKFPRDWQKAYDIYHQVWDKTNARVLVDKSPPNLAKCGRLSSFYDTLTSARGVFIVMMRAPCSKKWYERGLGKKLSMFEDCTELLPSQNTLILFYEDLILETERTTTLIQDFLSLHAGTPIVLNASRGSGTGTDRGLSIDEYKRSQSCTLRFEHTQHPLSPNDTFHRRVTSLWERTCGAENCFHRDVWNFSAIQSCPVDRACAQTLSTESNAFMRANPLS
jgi:hypothetical protein